MLEVKPFIKCVDYWPVKINPFQLTAYKIMIEHHQILKHHVTFNKNTGSTTVEYWSTIPHEWILQEMKDLVRQMTE